MERQNSSVRNNSGTSLVAALMIATILCVPAYGQNSAADKLSIGAEEPWVESVEWSKPAQLESNDDGDGVRYLLIDRQVNYALKTNYTHTVRLLVSESSVQDNGSVSFSFDPSFQKLVIHKVLIRRGNESIDQLSLDRVRLIQPEDQLPLGVYSGEHTALMILEDVRVGDVIEVASSIVGMNPVLRNEFAATYVCGFSVPVESQFLRILMPSDKKIAWRNHRHSDEPVTREANGLVDLTWRVPATEAIPYEDSVPVDVIQTPFIEVSTFPDWNSVARWADELYERRDNSEEMQKLIRQWRGEFSSRSERASAAIRFVQDKVRYFGIEVGPESFRPTRSAKTLERRYGDCKDKTLLLCDLLGELGIEATPVLVRSPSAELYSRLPSPFLFNHVIAQVKLDNRIHWVDPTRTLQRGPLNELPVGRFRTALVISDNTRDLMHVGPPKSSKPTLDVRKEFRVTSFDDPVEMTLQSVYRGAKAENMREYFATTARDSIEKNYLNYFADTYPGIHDPSLTIKDDEEKNVFRIFERYQINDFFSASDTGQLSAYCYPETLQGLLTVPSTRLRRYPLQIGHPNKMTYTTVVHLPEEWAHWSESESLKHDAFRFDWKGQCVGRKLTYEYSFQTLSDRVQANEIEDYLAKLEEVDTFLGDYIQQPKEFGLSSINWLLLALTTLFAVVLAGFTIWLLGRTKKPAEGEPYVAELVTREPAIGGWLVLVGIGVFFTPVQLVYFFAVDFASFFDIEVWQQAATPGGSIYHPLMAPLMIFELFVQVAMIVASIALVYLYVTHRRGFPKLYIGFALSCLLVSMLWMAITTTKPDLVDLSPEEAAKTVSQAMLSCMIWVPYMLVSTRVKETFVR